MLRSSWKRRRCRLGLKWWPWAMLVMEDEEEAAAELLGRYEVLSKLGEGTYGKAPFRKRSMGTSLRSID